MARAKRVGAVAALVVRLEIGAGFEHAERADLVEHAEALEHRKIHRQQRFTDVKARVMRLLQRNHPVAAPRQQGCGRAAGRGRRRSPPHRKLRVPLSWRSDQHAFNTAGVGAPHVIRQPVLAEQMLGNFHHDVIGVHLRIVVKALQTLQAGGHDVRIFTSPR